MNAILMAAGRGTRISRSISDSCKCALDIGGIPLIRHTVTMLLNHDIQPHIVVGYQQEQVRTALPGLPAVFWENPFYSVTNSLASLWWAREALVGDRVILGNADVFWEENLLTPLLDDPRDIVMLCDSSRVEQGDYLLRTENGAIKAYGKVTVPGANSEYVGLAKVRGELIQTARATVEAMVKEQRHTCWWEQVFYDMTPRRDVWALDIAGSFWAEIDFIEDYQRVLAYRTMK